jgi:low affinity Fe/Cu permease
MKRPSSLDHSGTRSSVQGALKPGAPSEPSFFGRIATETARLVGRPGAFLLVAALVGIWAASGPLFHFSETWLLFINTTTTIITTLVVFLIQNTQNRDTMALQLKLAELILVMEGTEPKMALAEDLTHEDLEQLKEQLRERAEDK